MEHDGLYVLSSHFKKNHSERNVDIVGQKAHCLLKTNPEIVPPFCVLSSTLFEIWYNKSEKQAEELLQGVLEECVSLFEEQGIENFIVRSSAKHESFEERGFYKSSAGNVRSIGLTEEILATWFSNKELFEKFADNKMAIIIQQYIEPKLHGHLSNERRISNRRRNFLYEIVDSSDRFIESNTFAATSRTKPGLDKLSLECDTTNQLKECIRKLGNYLALDNARHHVEWAWDMHRVWVVQNDIEDESYEGTQPGCDWQENTITNNKDLKSFSLPTSCEKQWDKVECIKFFADCELPTGNVYILDDSEIILKLTQGVVEQSLEDDLRSLLDYPVVVRMDKQNSDGYTKILLPRTETLFDIESVKSFLIENAKKFITEGLSTNDFCFLIHRFIVSKSCALAFAKPNIPQARIDSTWGIVDGLYYHPHDSFEITIGKDIKAKKKIRCKTEYLDVDSQGKWISKRAGTNWDWKESLTKDQLSAIANYTTKIASKLQTPVTVMFFVDIAPSTGYPQILPWFFTVDEIQNSSQKFKDIIFSQTRKVIRSREDFNLLKIETYNLDTHPKFTIKLKLEPDLLREKELIEEIGEYSYASKVPIELEGSILSHTYYILRKTGATVKCTDTFNPTYESQEFYKLVRDKVPVNIESKGEIAQTYEIDSNQLLALLREKAVEESLEFFWESDKDKSIEELADLLEVINATCRLFDIDIDVLQSIADKKREHKGGFEKGILLLETSESSLITFEDKPKSTKRNPTIKSINLKRGKLKIQAKPPDNSIVIPYIIGGFYDNLKKDPKYSVELDRNQIDVHYSKNGIIITIGKDSSPSNPSQLDLFKPKDNKEKK